METKSGHGFIVNYDNEEYLTSEDMESYQLYKVEIVDDPLYFVYEFEYEAPMREFLSKEGMHEFKIEKVWRSWDEDEQEWSDEVLETKTVNTIPRK